MKNMKKYRVTISVLVMFLITLMVLPASSFAAAHSKTDKDDSTMTKKIDTKVGTLVIDKVRVTDDFKNTEAKTGYKFLVVWLKVKKGTSPSEEQIEYIKKAKNIYIRGNDGKRVNKNMSGVQGSKLFIAFRPKKTAHKFRLYWPGNDSIYLGK